MTRYFKIIYLFFLLSLAAQSSDVSEEKKSIPFFPGEIWKTIIDFVEVEAIVIDVGAVEKNDQWFDEAKASYEKKISILWVSKSYYERLKIYIPVTRQAIIYKFIDDNAFLPPPSYSDQDLWDYLSPEYTFSHNPTRDMLVACAKISQLGDVNLRSNSGSAIISLFVRLDIPEREIMENLTKKLLKRGADVNLINMQGTNAVWWAVRLDRPSLLRLFMNHDADLDIRSQAGQTNNLNYYRNGSLTFRNMLPEERAWREGATLLHWAAYCNFPEIVEILLENRLDPQSRSDNGQTVLDIVEHSSCFQSDEEKELMLEKLRAAVRLLSKG